mmetsp:Transcript_24352/g.66410  ORF Transcript_24352/g.66410 Transcript_24352/m.66410 type:complete len:222 (-) Transcript_24352:161-826(-)
MIRRPEVASEGAPVLVEGTLVENLGGRPEKDASPSPRRRCLAPKPTMFFKEEPIEDATDLELRKLGEAANSLPLEGHAAELATQLKRELLSMDDGEIADGYFELPRPTGARVPSEVIPDAVGHTNSVVEGRLVGEERLASKLADGTPLLELGGRMPDFSRYSRLSPLILESLGFRLGSLSKEEIRSENRELRDQISQLRSLVKKRREELRPAGSGPSPQGT